MASRPTLRTSQPELGTRNSELGTSPAARPVALTFDDGLRDFYTAAFPILREHGFGATMYLPTAFITDRGSRITDHATRNSELGTRPTPPPAAFKNKAFLSWNQVRELHQAGIEFGSHTVNHPKLVDLGWDKIEFELRNSQLELEARLGVATPAFAYPYAFPQADRNFAEAFRQLLHQVGYASCVTTEVGRARPGDDPFRLSRLPVNSDDDDALLRAKLAGHYDWLAFPQALLKKIKHAVRPARKRTEAPARWSVVSVP